MWLKLPPAGQDIHLTHGRPGEPKVGLVATLGSFDGIHLGHQRLLAEVRKQAAEQYLEPALLTFNPHPAKIIRGAAPRRLSSFRQMAQLLSESAISNLLILRFNKKLSRLEAAEFVESILIDALNVRHLAIGPFARIGRNRTGTTEWICDYLYEKGLSSGVVEPVSVGTERVSSSLIRNIIGQGDLEHAASLLGRPFAISSRVVHGDSRGRKLQFPTANLQISDYVKPPYGVYFCKALLGMRSYYALANFGMRPTFGVSCEVLESFLIDYKGPDFYGQRMELQMLKKLRDERRFESADALRAQIKLDLETAKELIEKRPAC